MTKHSRPKRYTNWYLREWLDACRMTQADLVGKTDYSKAQISLLYNDRQSYTPEIIRDMALALNIAPYELLMHPEDANALRRFRREALQVVHISEAFDRTGTNG